jgi:hypothetical protein
MPTFLSSLSVDDLTTLLFAIVLLLIPLMIWLFWDLEQRRQDGWRRRVAARALRPKN